jgi:hypothetical protein
MKGQLKWVVGLGIGAGLLAATAGLLFGLHNTITPYLPPGMEAAGWGGVYGVLLGAWLGAATRATSGPFGRAISGALFAAPLGLVFGLFLPAVAVPPGFLGALAGALLGAAFLSLVRYRVLLGFLACAWVLGAADPEKYAAPERAASELPPLENYDVTPRAAEGMEPGLVVDDEPPEGWSHLIIKNHYKVSTGDVEQFPKTFADAVAMYFMALTADVQAEKGENKRPRYRLAKLGIGVGTRVRDQDRIITSRTQRQLGANLGFLEQASLAKNEDRQRQNIRLKARSNTMAIIDEPTFFFRDGQHSPGVLRHIVLVDPATGRLETLVFWLDPDAPGHADAGRLPEPPVALQAGGPVEWLPPSKVNRYLLHTDAARFTFGLPTTEDCLAIPALPSGQRQFTLSGPVLEAAGKLTLTAEQARTIEQGLTERLKAEGKK